ncbi:MAG TPA: YidB family protein [Candidatus Polarisedimenticolaceae bacterium]|nr:YidB family protein [Candidatus Polarisedimenticolaceae bacterium]
MGLLDELTAHLQQNASTGTSPGLLNSNAVGAVMGLLQSSGGISGIAQKFEQQGLGNLVNGWISTGPNPPATPGQVQSAIGQGKIEEIAGNLGITPSMAASFLATALPAVIDKLTPNGSVPQNEHSLLGEALNFVRGGLGSLGKQS